MNNSSLSANEQLSIDLRTMREQARPPIDTRIFPSVREKMFARYGIMTPAQG